jgi:hypothetical protein
MVAPLISCYSLSPFSAGEMVSMVSRIRPFATMRRELRQARKGATVTVALGAGDRRVRVTTPTGIHSMFLAFLR